MNYLTKMAELRNTGIPFRLIVIDAQNDFVDSALPNKEAQEAVPSLAFAINAARNLGAKVIFTKDTHYAADDTCHITYLNTQEGKKLPVEHCIKGTSGHDIVPEIYVAKEDTIIEKETFGYLNWRDPNFGPDEVIFMAGFCTDICVVSNALIIKATYPELPVYVIAECCAGVTPETHEAALTTMKSCQVNVI